MDKVVVKDKHSLNLAILWSGVLLFGLGIMLRLYFETNVSVSKIFIALGAAIAACSMLKSMSLTTDNRSKTFMFLIISLCFWQIVMLFRSDLTYLLSYYYYFDTYGVLPFCVVAILFIPTISLVRSFIDISYKLGFIYLFIFFLPILTWNNGFKQEFMETLAIGSAFIYITNKYHSNKRTIIALAVLFLSFLVATIEARRNLMLTFALYIMFGSFNVVFNGKMKSLETKLVTIICGLMIVIGAAFTYINQSSGAFSLLSKRASENTREEVFMYFFLDFHSPKDLAFGRGIFGTYYCPGVDENSKGEVYDDRGNIECGYLQALLKGGGVYLTLYITIFILAIYKGFRSNNQLCKASACIALVQLIDMAPFGLHAFNMKTFMIWMAISICLDEDFRKLTNNEVSKLLIKNKTALLPWQKK